MYASAFFFTNAGNIPVCGYLETKSEIGAFVRWALKEDGVAFIHGA